VNYPYHRLLLFLVSRKVDVNEALGRYGLPPVGGIWIAQAKTRLRKQAPQGIASYVDGDEAELLGRDGIIDWAYEEGFSQLWRMQPEFGGGPPHPDLDLAFRIFTNPYSRALLGLLLLSDVDDETISKISVEKFDLALSEDVIAVYRRIFWDIRVMGQRSWNPFIEELKTKEEIHYISLGLASPNIDEIREILGLTTVVKYEDIVSHIASSAHMLYKRAILEPIPEHAGAIKWADLALKAVATKKQLIVEEDPDELLLRGEGFKGLFAVTTTSSTHPTLADLQGVKPEPVRPKLPEEDS